jgi:hypothetical protein
LLRPRRCASIFADDTSGTLKFYENEIFGTVSHFQPEKEFDVNGMIQQQLCRNLEPWGDKAANESGSVKQGRIG